MWTFNQIRINEIHICIDSGTQNKLGILHPAPRHQYPLCQIQMHGLHYQEVSEMDPPQQHEQTSPSSAHVWTHVLLLSRLVPISVGKIRTILRAKQNYILLDALEIMVMLPLALSVPFWPIITSGSLCLLLIFGFLFDPEDGGNMFL
jgi:hypothetical protein